MIVLIQNPKFGRDVSNS